ncbi:MAG: (d)CMP kinase [Armatimonadota bacterium]|nr:(d)CMP kinase [Armatimonadota bacterium]
MSRGSGRRPAVAIDGPTAAGKSSVAREVARRLGYAYLDTGAMYRAVALAARRRGVALRDDQTLTRLARGLAIDFTGSPDGGRVLADGEDVTDAIRSPVISEAASRVSTKPGVREAMVARQRVLAAAGGVVMEGRDIGTVVLPDAEVKVFLTASLEARAARRHAELLARGLAVTLDEVRRQVEDRDRRDETRAHSPLRPAPDAVVVDTTDLTLEQAIAAVLEVVRRRTEA